MRRALVSIALLSAAAVLLAGPFNHAAANVAFMGDSITQGWSFPRSNLGIYGQTTGQMLARFPASIAARHYREVVILGGTNDTLLGLDPSVTTANLAAMVDLARQEGVQPVLAEIPPIYNLNGRYLPAVRRLNAGIAGVAAARGVPLVDYFDALDGHPGAFSDGTHLKRRGYLRMEWALLASTHPF